MTEPIKGCPQPDPPELVRLVDGYHYQSEDEMKELTDEDLDRLMKENVPTAVRCPPGWRNAFRAAIDADRALNAEDHDPLEPKRLESIADPTLRAVCEAYTNTPGGHFVRLQAVAKLVAAPADRGVSVEEGDSTCQELDGCPTEKAVLQRFWREHQSTGTPVAWLLTDKNINHIQVESVQRLIDRARGAHYTNLIIRVNGKDEHYQADWLKHLTRAIPPSNHSADRDVMQDGFDVELSAEQEARWGSWIGTESMTPWQRSVARLTLLLNTTKRGLIDYSASQHFARELMERTRSAAPTPSAKLLSSTQTESTPVSTPWEPPKTEPGTKHLPVPTARELDMAMAIRRIVSSARRNCEDGSNVLKLANEAWSYLVRQGLEGSPLRDTGIESDAPAESAPASEQPVAVIGKNWDIFWVGAQSIAEIARRNNLKVGMKLYTHPSPPLATLRAKVEALETAGENGNLVFVADVLAEIDKLGGGV